MKKPLRDKVTKSASNLSELTSDASGFSVKNTSMEETSSHKFYGCKRKEQTNTYSESFALPDDPIFASSTLPVDEKSPLGANPTQPQDFCLIDCHYIDQPWLYDKLLMLDCFISPYCNVDCLVPFDLEDIRHKAEPDLLSENSDDFQSMLEESKNHQSKLFTSTPLKNTKPISDLNSKVTINMQEDSNLNLALLKDQVLRALEEAIGGKNTVANIDIQIVADLSTAFNKSQKACVEVRINDNNVPSTSSSKENICLEGYQTTKETVEELNLDNSSNLAETKESVPFGKINKSATNVSKKRQKKVKKHSAPKRRSLRSINNISKEVPNLTESQPLLEEERFIISKGHVKNSELDSMLEGNDLHENKYTSINVISSTTECESFENAIEATQVETSLKKNKRGKPDTPQQKNEEKPRKNTNFLQQRNHDPIDSHLVGEAIQSQEQSNEDCVKNVSLTEKTQVFSENSDQQCLHTSIEIEPCKDVSTEYSSIQILDEETLISLKPQLKQKQRRRRRNKSRKLSRNLKEPLQHFSPLEATALKAWLPNDVLPQDSTEDSSMNSQSNENTPVKRVLRSSFKQDKEIKLQHHHTSTSDTIKNQKNNLLHQKLLSENLHFKTDKTNVGCLESVLVTPLDDPQNFKSDRRDKMSFGETAAPVPSKKCADLSAEVENRMPFNAVLKNALMRRDSNAADLTEQNLLSNVADDLPVLSRQDCPEEDLKEKKVLVENGIVTDVQVLLKAIEPGQSFPVLSSELPEQEPFSEEKPKLDLSVPNEQVPEISLEAPEEKFKILDDMKDVKLQFYNCGDFVWARFAGFPYWPAIVCEDPETGTHYKEEKIRNYRSNDTYHIRFFGDYGRRAWINKELLMLYCSKDDLSIIVDKFKSSSKNKSRILKHFVVRRNENWNRAIAEIESQKCKPYKEIINFMLDSIEKRRMKIREKRRLSMADYSSESESEDCEPGNRQRKKRFKSSLSQSEYVSMGFDEINLSVGRSNTDVTEALPNSFSVGTTTIITSEPIAIKRSSLKHPQASTSLSETISPRRSQRSVKAVEKFDLSHFLIKKSPLVVNPAALLIKKETEEESGSKEEEAKKTLDINSEGKEESVDKEQSDKVSEVGSKTSSDSGVSVSNMYSFDYQLELHKRNNIYHGMKNVKVCDYCLKQGEVYRCKGKCNGIFHLKCASMVTQPRTRKPAKSGESSRRSRFRNLNGSGSSTPRRSSEGCRTRSQSQCEIITIKSKHAVDIPSQEVLPEELTISEKIDLKMKQVMSKFDNNGVTVYNDTTDSSSEDGYSTVPHNSSCEVADSPASFSTLNSETCSIVDNKSSDDFELSLAPEDADSLIQHVTADSDMLKGAPLSVTNVICTYCRIQKDPPCFACGLEVSKRGDGFRQKCSLFRCGRFYHPTCLKMWPQTQWPMSAKLIKNHPPEDSFTCPAHRCHTCFSEELGSSLSCRLPGDKLARCVLCPAAFHSTTFCTPAGSEILGGSQIVCPRHRSKLIQPINTVWCFICSEGGNLVCCDTCPTSVHLECQPVNFTDDDKYICEDCESGRFPLYDEIVWVKLGQYRWWPAIILFPNEVPQNLDSIKHHRGDFVVKFFGTNDFYWVNKSRAFLFQEGDQGGSGEPTKSKSKVYKVLEKAVEDARRAYELKKEFKLRREAECIDSLKPPPYIKINKNKPVGRVKTLELNLSNATACECDPNQPNPCGPDSRCINRLLLTECSADVCLAGIRCRNQSFQKRDYPPMVPYKTQGRGWGLKTLAPIKKGQFVIEYVGELIDSEEYQRRIRRMHDKKEENYYFMTVDSERMIDAGPKGNLSRFMNHCCDPNCVTQKWTVKADTRVGLFAKHDIEAGSELTFNYNLEVVGQEKKVCKCGATNCSGFIGVKPEKSDKVAQQSENVASTCEPRKSRKYTKKSVIAPQIPPCFICGRKKSDVTCTNKFCNKGYHLRCLGLSEIPDVTRYSCPRHNCNICSHRTIRCCVKCTNSFCPSHSDLNVRYDKFLGFVCRSHDPVLSSSTDEQPETINSKETVDEFDQPQDVVNILEDVTVTKESAVALDQRTKQAKVLKPGKISDRRLTFRIRGGKQLRSMWRIKNRRVFRRKSRRVKDSFVNHSLGNEVQDFHDLSGSTAETKSSSGTIENGSIEVPTMHDTATKLTVETLKTPNNKRLRSEFDSTPDESTVSSTTSDEANTSKRAERVALSLPSTETTNKDDHVSSLSIKHHPDALDLDDVSLQERLRRGRVDEVGSRKRLRVKNSVRSPPSKRARYNPKKV